jgi:hypothetical protein
MTLTEATQNVEVPQLWWLEGWFERSLWKMSTHLRKIMNDRIILCVSELNFSPTQDTFLWVNFSL